MRHVISPLEDELGVERSTRRLHRSGEGAQSKPYATTRHLCATYLGVEGRGREDAAGRHDRDKIEQREREQLGEGARGLGVGKRRVGLHRRDRGELVERLERDQHARWRITVTVRC